MAAATLGLSGLGFPSVGYGEDLWEIYRIALSRDAAYRAAEYRYEGARLDLPLAQSAFRPTLSVQGSAGWTRGNNSGSTVTDNENQLSLNAELPVYDRTLRGEISQAELAVDGARIRFEQARHALILRVAERYFGVLAARDGKEVARRQKLSIRRQMDLAAERLAVGLGTETDLFDAEARFQQAVADEIQADNRIDNAVQALRQVIGNTPGALATLGDDAPLEAPAPASADAWVGEALTRNLALQSADIDLKIAAEEIEKQRAARHPRLGLDASRQRRDAGDRAFGPVVTNSTSVGATLSWPLYRGGVIRIRTKQAALRFDAAEREREELRRQVESDTISAYLAVTSGISQVKALSEAVRAGESALRAKEEGFRAGLTTNLDVLDAQRDVSRSRTEHLGARYDFILSVLRLEQAVGDLDEDDVKKINAWLTGG